MSSTVPPTNIATVGEYLKDCSSGPSVRCHVGGRVPLHQNPHSAMTIMSMECIDDTGDLAGLEVDECSRP